jgi:hypothetical protein
MLLLGQFNSYVVESLIEILKNLSLSENAKKEAGLCSWSAFSFFVGLKHPDLFIFLLIAIHIQS